MYTSKCVFVYGDSFWNLSEPFHCATRETSQLNPNRQMSRKLGMPTLYVQIACLGPSFPVPAPSKFPYKWAIYPSPS